MRVRRILRRLGWDRNPLRRRWDRQEAWLNAVLLVVLFAAGTPLAAFIGRDTYRDQARVAEWERQHRFQVWAVLLERAPAPARTAKARWKAPDGSPRIGAVGTGTSTQPGTWVPIWVDEKGAVAGAPPRRRPATQAAEAATAAEQEQENLVERLEVQLADAREALAKTRSTARRARNRQHQARQALTRLRP